MIDELDDLWMIEVQEVTLLSYSFKQTFLDEIEGVTWFKLFDYDVILDEELDLDKLSKRLNLVSTILIDKAELHDRSAQALHEDKSVEVRGQKILDFLLPDCLHSFQ